MRIEKERLKSGTISKPPAATLQPWIERQPPSSANKAGAVVGCRKSESKVRQAQGWNHASLSMRAHALSAPFRER